MGGVFISYARADDEPFVKQLYQDLKEHGIDVWWDRQAMESRGLTF
jgi:TIR domain-containing protein